MKRGSVLAAAVAVFTCSSAAFAAETAPAAPADNTGCCACPADPTVTGDVYVGPVSKYLFRGNDLSKAAYGADFAIQGGIDLYYKAFTLSFWGNAVNRYSKTNANNYTEVYDEFGNLNSEFTGYKKSKYNETDLILDYAVPYTLPLLDNLKFNVGTQYFAVDGAEDTNEFYLKASYDTLLKPTLAVYWDTMAATKAGLFYTASISHKITLERNLLSFNMGALASYNQFNPSAAYTVAGDGVYSDWHNYELTAGIDYTPTANITVTPFYMFSDALSPNARAIGIGPQNAYGIKAMFAF